MKTLNGLLDDDKGWIISDYWLLFNPKTGKGEVLLNIDKDADPDQRIADLSPETFVAVATVLKTGNAVLQADGSIYAKV